MKIHQILLACSQETMHWQPDLHVVAAAVAPRSGHLWSHRRPGTTGVTVAGHRSATPGRRQCSSSNMDRGVSQSTRPGALWARPSEAFSSSSTSFRAHPTSIDLQLLSVLCIPYESFNYIVSDYSVRMQNLELFHSVESRDMSWQVQEGVLHTEPAVEFVRQQSRARRLGGAQSPQESAGTLNH